MRDVESPMERQDFVVQLLTFVQRSVIRGKHATVEL